MAFNSSMRMAVGASGDSLRHQPYHPSRILFQTIVYVYWVLFIFIGTPCLLVATRARACRTRGALTHRS